MKKTICYARVSKDEQHPENQFASLKQKGESLGQPFELFEEKESTRNTRPIKESLMQRCREGEFDVVIVWSVDRFARSSKELVVSLDEFKRLKVRFISIKNNLDFLFNENKYDPFMEFQFNILAAFSELERSMISMRTKEGQTRALADGKRIGRHPQNCFCGNCKNSKLNIQTAKKAIANGGVVNKPPFSEQGSEPAQTSVCDSPKEGV